MVDTTPDDAASTSREGSTAKPLDVSEALTSGERPVAVSGYVFVDGQDVRMSTDILETYPPQPGEITIVVRGLDLADLAPLERVGGIAWTPRPVVVRGVVKSNVLVIVPEG